MTKEIVVRMHQRNVAMAHRQAWRASAALERERQEAWERECRDDAEYARKYHEAMRIHPVTPQQSRLERAAAYFRAVFK